MVDPEFRALQAGGLHAAHRVEDFTDAVRKVADGGTVLDVAILEVLRDGDPTDRELAILELAAESSRVAG
jgi:DNA-binding NarL/FixJ family response regulator